MKVKFCSECDNHKFVMKIKAGNWVTVCDECGKEGEFDNRKEPATSSGSELTWLLGGLGELQRTLSVCAKHPMTKNFSFRDRKRHERYAEFVERAMEVITSYAV